MNTNAVKPTVDTYKFECRWKCPPSAKYRKQIATFWFKANGVTKSFFGTYTQCKRQAIEYFRGIMGACVIEFLID